MDEEVEYEIVQEPTVLDKFVMGVIGVIATLAAAAAIESVYTKVVIDRRNQTVTDTTEE